MNHDTQKEIAATTRWGVALLVGILAQGAAIFLWAGNLTAKVDQNTADIAEVEERVDNINDDIRSILLGIEQVKARLGIIEANP